MLNASSSAPPAHPLTAGMLVPFCADIEKATAEGRRHFEPLRPALDDLYESLEPETFGGAMLLGVNGVCIVSHGSSSPKAVVNAIRTAKEMVAADLVSELRATISGS